LIYKLLFLCFSGMKRKRLQSTSPRLNVSPRPIRAAYYSGATDAAANVTFLFDVRERCVRMPNQKFHWSKRGLFRGGATTPKANDRFVSSPPFFSLFSFCFFFLFFSLFSYSAPPLPKGTVGAPHENFESATRALAASKNAATTQKFRRRLV